MQESTLNPEHEANKKTPRAFLLKVITRDETADEARSSLAEMVRLATTLGIEVVAEATQSLSSPIRATYLGSGKIDEISTFLEDQEDPIDVVLVDGDLSPRQQYSLEKAFGIEVLDRTGVILEIFEQRARTKEARLQVEIARLRYELPRQRDTLDNAGRRGGGGRGERGNTNVELSKDRIRDRITALEEELTRFQDQAQTRRQQRSSAFQVALVGYTNAGKSSLMRGMTGSDVLVEDQLFATLGTTVRRLDPPTTPEILLSDTVGFIKNLPHQLVASFRSTLDEALEADWLLFVVDASDPEWPSQLATTRETLTKIGADHLPHTLVLNKSDRIDPETQRELKENHPDALLLSALNETDREKLYAFLIQSRDGSLVEDTLLIPYAHGKILGEIYDRARVVTEEHLEEGTRIHLLAPKGDLDRWKTLLK